MQKIKRKTQNSMRNEIHGGQTRTHTHTQNKPQIFKPKTPERKK